MIDRAVKGDRELRDDGLPPGRRSMEEPVQLRGQAKLDVSKEDAFSSSGRRGVAWAEGKQSTGGTLRDSRPLLHITIIYHCIIFSAYLLFL